MPSVTVTREKPEKGQVLFHGRIEGSSAEGEASATVKNKKEVKGVRENSWMREPGVRLTEDQERRIRFENKD